MAVSTEVANNCAGNDTKHHPPFCSSLLSSTASVSSSFSSKSSVASAAHGSACWHKASINTERGTL
jgi:hypothetical protein